MKNFFAVTLLSLGMPMISMGEEARRQRGNNNAYCQHNELSGFDWGLVERHADVHRFVTLLNQRWPSRNARLRPVTLTQLVREARLRPRRKLERTGLE